MAYACPFPAPPPNLASYLLLFIRLLTGENMNGAISHRLGSQGFTLQ